MFHKFDAQEANKLLIPWKPKQNTLHFYIGIIWSVSAQITVVLDNSIIMFADSKKISILLTHLYLATR